jgi:hypothetical protein
MPEHTTYRDAIQVDSVGHNAKTQRARILRLLIDAHGSWVPLPKILALGIAQYNARLWELRRLGFVIENKSESVDGTRHSWYRLVSSPTPPAPTPAQKPEPPKPSPEWRDRPRSTGLPLFDLGVKG